MTTYRVVLKAIVCDGSEVHATFDIKAPSADEAKSKVIQNMRQGAWVIESCDPA